MKAYETIGEVNEQHELRAQLPLEVPVGAARVLVWCRKAMLWKRTEQRTLTATRLSKTTCCLGLSSSAPTPASKI